MAMTKAQRKRYKAILARNRKQVEQVREQEKCRRNGPTFEELQRELLERTER